MSIGGFSFGRTLRTITFATFAILAGTMSSLAQDGEDAPNDLGFYFSAAGGGVFLPNIIHRFRDIAVTTHKYGFQEGFGVQGAMGLNLPHKFRAEVEVTYRENGVDRMVEGNVLTPGFSGISGDYTSTTVMLNGLYDINITDSLTFSPGIGVGVAMTDFNVAQGAFAFARGDDTRFAAQAVAELGWEIINGVSLFAKWQYLVTVDKNQTTFNTAAGSANRSIEYQNHTVLGGVKINLSTLTEG